MGERQAAEAGRPGGNVTGRAGGRQRPEGGAEETGRGIAEGVRGAGGYGH